MGEETVREGSPRPGAEAHRRVRAEEQERGVESEVHPGQDQVRRQGAPHPGGEGLQETVRGQRSAQASGEDWSVGRGQDEAGLRSRSESRGFPGATSADSSFQAGTGQVYPSRPSSDQAEAHQSEETGMNTPRHARAQSVLGQEYPY